MIDTPYVGIIYGLAGVMLFRFRNPHRNYLNIVSILTLLVFATEILFFEFRYPAGPLGWAAAGILLILAYWLRVQSRTKKTFLDYIKFVGIIFVALYPLNFYTFDMFENNRLVLISITWLLLPAVACIFIYDRYILNPEHMKRKFVFALVLQTTVIFVVLVYASFQRTQAIKVRDLADKNAKEALMQKAIAEANANEAMKQRLLAEANTKSMSAQLEECQRARNRGFK